MAVAQGQAAVEGTALPLCTGRCEIIGIGIGTVNGGMVVVVLMVAETVVPVYRWMVEGAPRCRR